MSQALDYTLNSYFAVTVSSSSAYIADPGSLAAAHPSLQYVSKVGELADVLLFGAPKSESDVAQQALVAAPGVERVDAQVPVQRAKRRHEF